MQNIDEENCVAEMNNGTTERNFPMGGEYATLQASIKMIVYSLCGFVLGCGSGSAYGYQLHPTEAKRMAFSHLKFEVPYGEACINDDFWMADYHGKNVKVNATAKRIVLAGERSTGLFSSEPFSASIPFDSILAYRKAGLNSACFVTEDRCAHLLSFDVEFYVSFSGVKLPLTDFLECLATYVIFSARSGYHEKWLLNLTHLYTNSTDLNTLPIGFRIRKSRLPFGGYVGCIHNLLDREITVKIMLEDKECSTRVGAGDEISFGASEMGRSLKEGDIMTITTSASEHKWLMCHILKDGDYACEVKPPACLAGP